MLDHIGHCVVAVVQRGGEDVIGCLAIGDGDDRHAHTLAHLAEERGIGHVGTYEEATAMEGEDHGRPRVCPVEGCIQRAALEWQDYDFVGIRRLGSGLLLCLGE